MPIRSTFQENAAFDAQAEGGKKENNLPEGSACAEKATERRP